MKLHKRSQNSLTFIIAHSSYNTPCSVTYSHYYIYTQLYFYGNKFNIFQQTMQDVCFAFFSCIISTHTLYRCEIMHFYALLPITQNKLIRECVLFAHCLNATNNMLEDVYKIIIIIFFFHIIYLIYAYIVRKLNKYKMW